jgi:hypothetical protein
MNIHLGVILEKLGLGAAICVFLIAGKTDIIRLNMTWLVSHLLTLEIEAIS